VIPKTFLLSGALISAVCHYVKKSLAQELAPHKIRVNSISPGAVKTDFNRQVWEKPEENTKVRTLIPYGRIGEPEDIAYVTV
jgi:glucose 1-dehydrogenase